MTGKVVNRSNCTKRLILEICELAEAFGAGRSYQARLDPQAADPRVADPPPDPQTLA
jgi:hypothetical protein